MSTPRLTRFEALGMLPDSQVVLFSQLVTKRHGSKTIATMRAYSATVQEFLELIDNQTYLLVKAPNSKRCIFFGNNVYVEPDQNKYNQYVRAMRQKGKK